jgi:hypothetical protein
LLGLTGRFLLKVRSEDFQQGWADYGHPVSIESAHSGAMLSRIAGVILIGMAVLTVLITLWLLVYG